MRFPPEFIERLRNHVPISSVIGKRIPLRKHGREFQACCPFHKEKTPSFTINDDKGFFHCFGCSAHGDAIGFIKDYEGITYPEAVERLASEAGVALPVMTREAQAQERKRHTLEEVMQLAAHWFSEQLLTNLGREAREYLATRGLQLDMIQKFGIGFAPNNREALQNYLTQQNVPRPAMVEAGLLSKTDDGSLYDRFRGRLMFPIKSPQGKIIAFGGRILPSAQTPNSAKYLNSPETPLFKKGENLFAYDTARFAGRDKGTLIVAEGYMDVIALHQAGFTNAVAPLGTAVTEEQLKLLWRTTPEPVFCLDGDNAGKRAMLRAAEIALPHIKAGLTMRFAFLPAGEDPDTLIRNKGAATMQAVLTRSQLLSEMLWDDALARYGVTTPEQRAALEHYLNEHSNRIADKPMAQHMQQYFRERLYEASRQSSRQNSQKGKKPAIALETAKPGFLPDINEYGGPMRGTENQLVSLIIHVPVLLDLPDIEERFCHLELSQSVLDKLRATILEIHAESGSLDSQTLRARLKDRGFGEKVDTLLQSDTTSLLPSSMSRFTADNAFALRSFDQMYHAYTYQRMLRERNEAEQAMQQTMNEENYSRFLALNEQCETLRRERYSAAPDEQFS